MIIWPECRYRRRTVNPAVPAALSRIILHLLEKDPDQRYQSADGLVHDLNGCGTPTRRRQRRSGSESTTCRRCCCPRPGWSGRDTEVAALREAFDGVLAGRCQVLLVGGPPGVGKTALVDQLRPKVTGSDAWFVAGKFDQYRRDLEFDGVAQAFRALGRLLLAESEGELTAVRERLLAALGPNAGLATAVLPEFATLLGIPPEPGDPLTAQMRAQRNAVRDPARGRVPEAPGGVLRRRPAVGRAYPARPVRPRARARSRSRACCWWAPIATAATSTQRTRLPAMLARWQREAGVRHLRLDNLPAPAWPVWSPRCCTRHRTAAAELARGDRAAHRGQPLRHRGAARRAAPRRAADAERRRLALGRRGSAPARGRGRARRPVDGPVGRPCRRRRGRWWRRWPAWADEPRSTCCKPRPASRPRWWSKQLAPALDDGLLVAEPERSRPCGSATTACARPYSPQSTRRAASTAARAWPGGWHRCRSCSPLAAEQYLGRAGRCPRPAERQAVVDLLRGAADQAALIGDHALAERCWPRRCR